MQLIQRVERHELHAGVREYLFTGNDREGTLQHSVGSRIAIMARIIRQRAVTR